MTTITLNSSNLTELNDGVFAKLDAMIADNTDWVDSDDALDILDAMIEETEDDLKQQILDNAGSLYTFDFDVTIEAQTEKAILISWVDGYKKTAWVPKKAIFIEGACNVVEDAIMINFEKWFLKSGKSLPTNDTYVDVHQQENIDSAKNLALHKNNLLAKYGQVRYNNFK